MSRIITSDIIEEYQAKKLSPFFLIEFEDIDGDKHKYTSLDVSQFISASASPSGTFDPLGFKFENITYSMGQIVDDATIRIDNLDQVMTSFFVGTDIQEQDATIWAGVLNVSGGIIAEPFMLFTGEIDSFTIDESELLLMIASPFSKWSHKSHGKHSSSCRWKVFKGTECQYSDGQTWCDRSYSRCEVLNNTIHFGGFKYLPDIENKTIHWGPTAKEYREENN